MRNGWLKINYGKTEYLGRDHADNLQINWNTIPAVKHFRYLGSVIQEYSSPTLKLKKRMNERKRDINMLNSVLWNRNIVHSTKLLS
jgi:hypothetical protein